MIDAQSVDLEAVIRDAGAVVFDWNGTLVNDADRALAATNHVLHEHGLPQLDETAFAERFKLPMRVFFEELGVQPEQVERALQSWNEQLALRMTRLQPGARDLLRRLCKSGVPAGVVSAASDEAVRADAVALGIDAYLSFIAGSTADKFAALAGIRARVAGPMIYFGDTEYDMAAAHAAGAIAIGFGRGYRPHDALTRSDAVVVIDDYAELAPIRLAR